MATVINLTPHDVKILKPCPAPHGAYFCQNCNETGFVTIGEYKSEGVARAVEVIEDDTPVCGIPVVKKKYSKFSGLPPETSGVFYIVSVIVLNLLPKRSDLLCPDTGPESAVRDDKGRIIGVMRFQKGED